MRERLPNALCIFQRTRSWAFAAVSASVKVKADRPKTPSFNSRFDIWHSSHVGRHARREPLPSAHSERRHCDGTIVGTACAS